MNYANENLSDGEMKQWVEMYDNNSKIVANANISYCDEVGYCEYKIL